MLAFQVAGMLAFQVAGMLRAMTSLCSLHTASRPLTRPAADTVVSQRRRAAQASMSTATNRPGGGGIRRCAGSPWVRARQCRSPLITKTAGPVRAGALVLGK